MKENYPGLNDFSDALEAIPLEMVRHLTLLKEIDAKCTTVAPQLSGAIAEFMQSDSRGAMRENELKQIITLLKELMPCIEEKMHVANMAAETMARHTQRVDTGFELIADHEIPKHIQIDPSDPALSAAAPGPAVADANRGVASVRTRASNTRQGRGRRGTPQVDELEKRKREEEEDDEVPVARRRRNTPDPGEVLYCYCNNRGDGQMIACDGPDCRREWFHLSCLGMAQAPKGQWLCKECKKGN